jgi:hypothetical protein
MLSRCSSSLFRGGQSKAATSTCTAVKLTPSSSIIESHPAIIVAQLKQHISTLSQSQSYITMENNLEEHSSPFVAYDLASWSVDINSAKSIAGAFKLRKNVRLRRGKTRQDTTATYILPAWLSNRAWQWRQYEKYSGWRTVLQTYRVIPGDSPLFGFAEQGDIEGVRKLFKNKQASVSDKSDLFEKTALHVGSLFPRLCEIPLSV